MCVLECFTSNLQDLLTGTKSLYDGSIIRRHSRKLEQCGDISFPLSIKNWHHLLDRNNLLPNVSILNYNLSATEIGAQIDELKEKSRRWQITIEKVMINGNDVHLFLERSSSLLKVAISEVLTNNTRYGSSEIIDKNLALDCDHEADNSKLSELDLSTLRLLLLRDVALNLLAFVSKVKSDVDTRIVFTMNSMNHNESYILCGPVLNKSGVKDNKSTSGELFNNRMLDMKMMALHRYRVQVKSNAAWEAYFEKLGRAAVTIEMLSNKPNKALKLTMYDLRTANKGATFIFYNCARLSILFKEFERRVDKNIYPNLPEISQVDFELLNQPEEWDLFYVYILQFPIVVKNCIKDIEKGFFNPQHLVSFLSSLASSFSVYYRRVRILTDPRDHLFGVLHARIYLLKALQCVFHNGLYLLNIEPIKEM